MVSIMNMDKTVRVTRRNNRGCIRSCRSKGVKALYLSVLSIAQKRSLRFLICLIRVKVQVIPSQQAIQVRGENLIDLVEWTQILKAVLLIKRRNRKYKWGSRASQSCLQFNHKRDIKTLQILKISLRYCRNYNKISLNLVWLKTTKT